MKKFLPLLLILLLATTAFAQNKSRIIGTVTTADGAVVEGVQVTISSDALISSSMTTMTNERGMFRFVVLPIGNYTIKIEKEGYNTIEQKEVALAFDSTIILNKTLQLADFEEVITITGEAPIVDKTSTAIGDKLDIDFLQNMPNTRNVWGMPSLSAGFTDDSGLGAVQDSGNAYITDGVNVSDPATGTVFSSVNMESVEQVDVNLFGANAEYGAYTGASLNVVTKSGGNDFSGEFNYFMQRVKWVSDNTEEYNADGISAPTASKLDDPNIAVGGPVVKDKVWFFGNYNYSKSETQREVLNEGGGYKTIPTSETPKRFFGKISARWDDRNITYGQWTNYERVRSHRLVSAGWRQNYESTMWEQTSTSDTWLIQHAFVLNDNMIFEGRFARFDGGFDLLPRDPGPSHFDVALNQFIEGSKQPYETVYERGRDNLLLTSNYFNDDMAGQHSFKFGFEYERSRSWRSFYWPDEYYYWNGTPYYYWDSDYYDGGIVLKRFAGFAQDSWSLNDKLTVNYGFRYDSTGWAADDADQGYKGDETYLRLNDPAYRLGFAYDLRGDGKTIIRGFVGRYYEGAVAGNTEDWAIKEKPPYYFYYGEAVGLPTWTLYNIYGGDPSLFDIDPDISNQYTEGFTVGIEQELMPNLAAAANFVWKKDHNQIGTIAPDVTYDVTNINYTAENGSYSGVYYENILKGSRTYYTNPKEGDPGVLMDPYRKYWALVFEMTKRMSDNWSLRANYTYSKNTGNLGQGYGIIQGYSDFSNPEASIFGVGSLGLERTNVFKVSGTYIAPFDIFISPALTYMDGTGWVPEATPGDVTIRVEEFDGSRSYENQWNLDLRMEKAFIIADRYRLGVLFDVFNVLNDDAITGYRSIAIDSSNYMVPSSIVGARFFQLGFRLLF